MSKQAKKGCVPVLRFVGAGLVSTLSGDNHEGLPMQNIRIDLKGISLNIHSPHPQKEVKQYAVLLLREFLEKAGVTP